MRLFVLSLSELQPLKWRATLYILYLCASSYHTLSLHHTDELCHKQKCTSMFKRASAILPAFNSFWV